MAFNAVIRNQISGIPRFLPTDPLAAMTLGAAGAKMEADIARAIKLALATATGSDLPGRMVTGQATPAELSAVRTQGDLPPSAKDLKKVLVEKNDPLNPSGDLMRHKADLDELVKRKEIPKEWADKDWHETVKSKAESLGIGGQSQLPEAALRDTEASVRIINQWQFGGGQQTVEDLLRRLVELTERGNMHDRIDNERIIRECTIGVTNMSSIPR